MKNSNKLPRVAAIVAFVIAAICFLGGFLGPILAVPFALIPLCAGIGILRNRVWSAYGFGTFFLAQIALLPVVLIRPGFSTGRLLQIGGQSFLALGLGILFLFAGRSLAGSGATRGRALPWIVVAALMTVPFLFVQTFEIPSASMEDTLLQGDQILAQEFPRPAPERGKMAIFISPADRNYLLVKRVIAVPGDRIRIVKDVVILNGTALDEKYVTHKDSGEYPYGVDFPNDLQNEPGIPECEQGYEKLSQHVINGEIVVPADNYFVLGDNRENSLDSRCWGFVSSSDLIGKPLMIYDSIDQTADQASDANGNWRGSRRWARLFKAL